MIIGAGLGQYSLQTQIKKNYEDSMGESLNAPSGYGTASGQPAKLTFGQLVSKSTHHV